MVRYVVTEDPILATGHVLAEQEFLSATTASPLSNSFRLRQRPLLQRRVRAQLSPRSKRTKPSLPSNSHRLA